MAFEDLNDPENTVIIYSQGYGDNRAVEAAETAFQKVNNVNYDLSGTNTVYLRIISGQNEITLDEIGKLNDMIQSKTNNHSNIILSVEEKEIASDLEIIMIFTNLGDTFNERDFSYFLGQNKKDVSTLPIYFMTDEFSQQEIAQTISFLSDLYSSIGGDRLKIQGFQFTDVKVNSLEPVF